MTEYDDGEREAEGEEEGAGGGERKKLSKRRKQAEQRAHEDMLREAETREGDDAPRNAEDYERLIMTQGTRSSNIWLKYMWFHVTLGELDKARHVAERGVKCISCREEAARFAVWMGYLDMECKHGDNAEDVFKRAVQYNDAKQTYLHMSEIYERNGMFDKAKALCDKAIIKFSKSKKVWIRLLELLYGRAAAAGVNCGALEEARKAYEKGVSKLPKHKKMIVATTGARLEYKIGNIEQGQMRFENLVTDNPNRTDIWNQYFDFHIPAVSVEEGRSLFSRATSLQLKPRRMKVFFSRWLTFERQHGTTESYEEVQRRAREYVEGLETSC
eukprot:GHVQ01038808.1.p1 GENE.GHVQ01038808.1~~GHVQ01038808.1.p1  ORF type:complete len:329 (+),score=48.69 GHVQ01038808.1:431-1417(+)